MTRGVGIRRVAGAVSVAMLGLGLAVLSPARPASADSVPQATVNNVTVVEGDTGTTNAVFTVSLDAASPQPSSVVVSTSNSSAVAGSDYVAVRTLVSFAAGE